MVKALHITTFSLVILGGLNWGLVGLLDYDLVEALLGAWPGMVKLVYLLIGASAVYRLITHPGDCKMCLEMMKKGRKKR